MTGPLEGIRVLDWTVGQVGPVAAVMLGDLGADVIKIENPQGGEVGRGFMTVMGRSVTGLSEGRNFYFEFNNRNKRGITLDLTKDKGREVLYRLVTHSDVFLHNFRQGVAERLRVDYQTLSRHNPRLIYACANYLGQRGLESDKPGVDFVAQARSGAMWAAGEPDMPPLYLQVGLADQMGAIMLAYSTLSAIIARERLGVGQEVNTSLFAGMIFLQGLNVSARLMLGQAFSRFDRGRAANALWNYYQCGDGKWLCLAMLWSDRVWPDFCRAIGRPDLARHPKFDNMQQRMDNAAELVATLDGVFAAKPRAQWLEILREGGEDLIYEVVSTIDDLAVDPQALANDYITDFDHPVFGPIKVVGIPAQLRATPGSIRRPAPELGEHTEEILTEVGGYTWDEVLALREEEVI